MLNELPDTLGEAVFVTHDGLTAEGGGWLSSISDCVEVVEFRDANGSIDHLPPVGEIAFFGSVVSAVGQKVLLIGAVTRMSDAMNRPGFMGVCFAVERGTLQNAHVHAILPFLKTARQHHQEVYRHKRHTNEIGLLPSDPHTNHHIKPLENRQNFEIFIRGVNASEVETVMRLWSLAESTERTTLLWNTKQGGYPVLSGALVEQRILEANTERARVKAVLDQYSEVDDGRLPNSDRLDKFNQRGHLLGYARPSGVDVEFEDYLIGLIQFVNDQSGERAAAVTQSAIPSLTDPLVFPSGSYRHNKVTDWLIRNRRIAAAALVALVGLILITSVVFSLVSGVADESGEDTEPNDVLLQIEPKLE